MRRTHCKEGAYHERKPVGWETRRAGDAGKCPATDDGLLYAATGSLYTRATRGVRHLRPSRVCLLGVDPLGGAGVHYWEIISDRYKLPLTVVNEAVDPTFRFMTLDWDGQIRMDCSSSYAM